MLAKRLDLKAKRDQFQTSGIPISECWIKTEGVE